MKKLLIASLSGFLLTALLFIFAGLWSGACHCETPALVSFPYAIILLEASNWEGVATVLLALQFSLYAVILTTVKETWNRVIAALIILVLHAAAVFVGLSFYNR